jgi:hypothetical protein
MHQPMNELTIAVPEETKQVYKLEMVLQFFVGLLPVERAYVTKRRFVT